MFKCDKCNLELKNRFHECGVEDGPHKVEILDGGWWGNPKHGLSGTRDKNVS